MAVQILVRLNPMVPIISAYRSIVIDGQLPAVIPFLSSFIIALGLTLTAWQLYRALEGRFAERV